MENSPLLTTNYNPETKTIDVAYYLLKDNPNTFQIINVQENSKGNVIWANGATDYNIIINTEFLPKKWGEIVSPVNGIPGYYIFRIPYWLYKKDSNLQIKRIKDGPKKFSTPKNDDVIKLFGNKQYQEALEGVGTNMDQVFRTYDSFFGPKPEPKTSILPDDNKSEFTLFQPRKVYWGD